jgi:hypothetical protein
VTFSDIGILALCGLVGWAVVSWIFSVVQQQKRPPLDLTGGSPPSRDRLRGLPPPDAARDPVATPPDLTALPRGPVSVPGAFADNSVRDPRSLSLAEISARWSAILRVSESAAAQEIEAAYHAGIAECDRIRFSSTESAIAKSDAETRRAQITQAFEFIRPLKD